MSGPWLGVLAGALLSYGLGHAALALAAPAERSTARWALAGPLGFGLISLLCGELYAWAGPVQRWALALAPGLGGAGLLAVWLRRRAPWEPRAKALIALQALALALLVAPALLGGPNFFAFRGNKWDSYNYDAMALSADSLSREKLASASLAELAALNPVHVHTREHLLRDRLSTGAAQAFLARLGRVIPADMNYGMGSLALALGAPILAWLALRSGAAWGLALLLGLAASVGVWPQFLQDDDVLAHLQAWPLLALWVAGLGLLPRRSGILSLAVAAAALALAYPSALVLVVAASFLWLCLQRGRRRLLLKPASLALAFSLLLVLPVLPDILDQLRYMSAASGGLKGSIIYQFHYPWLVDRSTPARLLPGALGLEPLGRSWALYWGLAWSLGAIVVAGAWAAPKARRPSSMAALALGAACLGLALWMALDKNVFSACRVISYAAPFIGVALAAGAAAASEARPASGKFAWALVSAWALLQLGSGFWRVSAAATGRLNVPKYPTHLDSKERELDYDWRPLQAAVTRLDPALLAIDLRQPWVMERAQHVFADRKFWRVRPLITYHVNPRADGLSMPRPGEPDMVLADKRDHPRGVAGAELAAETKEMALYRMLPGQRYRTAL